MAGDSKEEGNKRADKDSFLGNLIESAVQVLAPNSLEFRLNEHEFQRSPKEAQDAARAAAKLVQPGCRAGSGACPARRHAVSAFDAAREVTLTSAPASCTFPNCSPHVVLRVDMEEEERQKFLRCARELIGRKYDIVRAYQLVLRLTLKHMAGSTPLRKLPLDVKSDMWICSDSIMYVPSWYHFLGHLEFTANLFWYLTSSSQGAACRMQREIPRRAHKSAASKSIGYDQIFVCTANHSIGNSPDLSFVLVICLYLAVDLFNHGSASLSDFTRIRGITPEVFTRVALPLVDYTLLPQKKSWKEHIPELVHFVTKLQAGKMKWPMLEETMFPKLHQFASQIPPTDWSVQQKVRVMGYSMVLLIVLKRGDLHAQHPIENNGERPMRRSVCYGIALVSIRIIIHKGSSIPTGVFCKADHQIKTEEVHFQQCFQAQDQLTNRGNMVNVTDAAKHAAGIPKGGLCLLVIDQQVDFHPGGSLAIPMANDDAERIAAFITKHSTKLSQLVFTLDSHQRYHIAHGIFWENAQGESPAPFTLITNKEIADGVWRPRDPELKEYVLAYTQSLEKSGKFTLCIWPEHCVVGTPGHNLVENVRNAALEWTKQSLKQIQYVMKGSNSFTEHYSALRAEFELPHDPATSLNQNLVNVLKHADKVVICGEALSHCVNYTVRDLVDVWPAERIQDLVILTDCASPVPSFESSGEQFLSDMAKKGLTLTTSTEFEA
ncbi:hypothetical protein FI667_g4179, partial [Globisporangium splendens]